MRVSIAFAVLFVSVLSVSSVCVGNDLFSEVAMESTFQATATSVATNDAGSESKLRRITGLVSLTKALQTAGFKPSKNDTRVLVEAKQDEWKFPLYLSVAAERDEVVIELPVVTIGASSKLDASGLLNLLKAGDSERGLYFAYNKQKGNIRLRHAISNRSVSAGRLKQTIEMMTVFAVEHSDAWSKFAVEKAIAAKKTVAAKPSGASKTLATTSSAESTVPPKAAKALSLVGLWSASISDGEAFAIRIQLDRRFQLVHMKAGMSKVSNGTVTRSGSQLTLKGDQGVAIGGRVIQSTNEAFQLDVNGTDGNVALSMKFTKSK